VSGTVDSLYTLQSIGHIIFDLKAKTHYPLLGELIMNALLRIGNNEWPPFMVQERGSQGRFSTISHQKDWLPLS